MMTYRKTSNKHLQHFLEHGLRSPLRLLETSVYSRPGIY